MSRIDLDEFWDDVAFGSSDYYEQKKRFKTLSFAVPKKKKNSQLWKS